MTDLMFLFVYYVFDMGNLKDVENLYTEGSYEEQKRITGWIKSLL